MIVNPFQTVSLKFRDCDDRDIGTLILPKDIEPLVIRHPNGEAEIFDSLNEAVNWFVVVNFIHPDIVTKYYYPNFFSDPRNDPWREERAEGKVAFFRDNPRRKNYIVEEAFYYDENKRDRNGDYMLQHSLKYIPNEFKKSLKPGRLRPQKGAV